MRTASRRPTWGIPVLALAGLSGGCGGPVSEDADVLARLPERVDFNHHVKPLLSDRCYACHGPDEAARKAGLRLDQREGILERRTESGARAVVPGSLRRSAVWSRIRSDDPKHRMPPPESKLGLSEYEKALIGRWIEQGGEWKPHWAFIAPERPEPPAVARDDWARNPIDRFVLARLEREGVEPTPEAGKERLIRRLSFDLRGLPPTLEEIDEFLADGADDAYERLVERFLASPAHAERLALDWMDVSRYADSHGLHADGFRYMWPWRDWVIASFAENLPYDRFLTLQFAGDLLEDAGREAVLATAFHRNHPMTGEGGVVDEEFRLEYVFDRAVTTSRGLLGLTLECARCHDHKFDPISQDEFYAFAAFFNNVKELGMTGDDGNAGPLLPIPEPDTEAKLREVRGEIAALEAQRAARREALAAEGRRPLGAAPSPRGLVAHFPLDASEPFTPKPEPGEPPGEPQERTREARSGRLDARLRGDLESVPGARGQALRFDGDYDFVDLERVGGWERHEPFSVALWVRPESDEGYRVLLGNAGDKNGWWRGWEIFLDGEQRPAARLINARPHNYVHVRAEERLPLEEWSHVALTWDGSSRAEGLRLFVGGREPGRSVLYDRLYKSIRPIDGLQRPIDKPVRMAKSYRAYSGSNGVFEGALDDVRFFGRRLSAVEVLALADADAAAALAARPPDAWTEAEAVAVLDHRASADAGWRRQGDALRALREKEHDLVEAVPEVMVMEELPEPQPMYVLARGNYEQPGERVEPRTPESVLSFPADLPKNRLGLVRWLLSAENPLTARVTVNRYWQMYFGQGLVATSEDFGFQGALPTHPGLLDWLAVEFRESGWDVRHVQRLIVTSATYRQDSAAAPELRDRDPENELLARGPRMRLPAEMIRDNALATSGLLVREVGGPSVKPYQPPGLWQEKAVFSQMLLEYEQGHGDDLYRRSMYTFLKRTSPPPSMDVFDAPNRSDCVVKRQTTTSPLQALVMMNDPQYVEAARVLAERMLREGGEVLSERLVHGFRLATSRRPDEAELAVLEDLFEAERDRFAESPDEAEALLSVGEWPRDRRLATLDLAPMAVVANALLNHDEAYYRR